MFEISNLEHIALDEAADKKIEKLRAEQAKVAEQIAKAEREVEQAENKIKRMMGALSKEQRKARSHRLIQRGAILEKFIPDAETLTNDELTAVLKRIFRASAN
jgi:uncharacterized coiled-coil DUF342 family protein